MIEFNIPAARTPLLDRLGGVASREWYKFFSLLFTASSRGYRPIDSGFAQLTAGTVTVSSRYSNSANGVHLTRNTTGGTVGHLTVGTVVNGTSFVINSSSATDTSRVFWTVFAPIL